MPGTYGDERRYVLDVVLRDWLGIDYAVRLTGDQGRVVLRAADDAQQRRLSMPDVFFATAQHDWFTARSLPSTPFRWWPTDRGELLRATTMPLQERPLPILFGAPTQSGSRGHQDREAMHLEIDVFGSVFFLVTRYEEVVTRTRDNHGRFPASASATAQFVERPIADEYVAILSSAVEYLWPNIGRRETSFRLWLTHDVDEPWATVGRRLPTIAHAVAGDLLKRRDPVLAVRRTRSTLSGRSGRVERDPFNSFDFLMNTSERHGLKSAFFFMSGAPGGIDGTYRISDRPIRSLIRSVHTRGHEVGLHATYGSYCSAAILRAEFDALRNACDDLGFAQPEWGVRQHFLRLDITETWASQESAGLDYDTSLGFADRIGFRAGTCREFQVFDLLRRRRVELRERPLLVMDASLFGYMGLGAEAAAARTRHVVQQCRRFQGQAVVLFHNSSLPTPRLRAQYAELVAELAH